MIGSRVSKTFTLATLMAATVGLCCQKTRRGGSRKINRCENRGNSAGASKRAKELGAVLGGRRRRGAGTDLSSLRERNRGKGEREGGCPSPELKTLEECARPHWSRRVLFHIQLETTETVAAGESAENQQGGLIEEEVGIGFSKAEGGARLHRIRDPRSPIRKSRNAHGKALKGRIKKKGEVHRK